ncbi:MAG: glycosyltransferase [Acidimicrobiales bacterium]
MRILFTTTPGWGHIHPMVPLARAFLDRGDEVLWATAQHACARLEREGFRAVPAGLEAVDMPEFFSRFPEIQQLPPPQQPDVMFPRLFGAVRAGPMLDDLLPVARDWRPSLVVHDAAELAGPIAAAAVGVPNASHAFGALLPPVRLITAGEMVAPLWEAQALTPPPYAGSYEHLYLDIYPGSLQDWDTAHVPVRQPLRPVTFAGAGDEDLPPLVTDAGADPLVYVTFGTVFNQDVGLVTTVVEALRDLPVRVVVTLGPTGDPSRLGPQPDHVHVARYIPQTELLAHCAAVVSHAGSGTFLAALSRGLPQLCLPQAADQFLNAAAGTRSGAGITLMPGTVTVEAVRRAVAQLLADGEVRAAAEGLSRELAAMPGPDEVARLLAARFGSAGV